MRSIGDVGRFDRFARLYHAVMPAAKAAELAAGLALADRPVERGLDVGGGTGRGASAVEGVDWTVVDAAAGMLREARGAGHRTVRGDAARLPVRDASVDAVMVVDALHHVADQAGALREAARVLRPGGVLVVREFDPGTLLGRALVLAERAVLFDSTFHRPDDLATMVEAAGLRARVPDRGFGYTVAGVKPRG